MKIYDTEAFWTLFWMFVNSVVWTYAILQELHRNGHI